MFVDIARQPEVRDLHHVIRANQNVSRGKVSMDEFLVLEIFLKENRDSDKFEGDT